MYPNSIAERVPWAHAICIVTHRLVIYVGTQRMVPRLRVDNAFPHYLSHKVILLHRLHGCSMLITVCSKLIILNKHTKKTATPLHSTFFGHPVLSFLLLFAPATMMLHFQIHLPAFAALVSCSWAQHMGPESPSKVISLEKCLKWL